MRSVIHVYGRGGDIIISMLVADLLVERGEKKPALCVHGNYLPLVDTMIEFGFPVSCSMENRLPPLFVDDRIFGSSIHPLSSSFFRNAYGEMDRHLNCCLGNIPRGIHVGGMMRYSTGLCHNASLDGVKYPLVKIDDRFDRVVYHLGSSSGSRVVSMPECPFPEMESVFVGLESDHVESWCDRDMRGIPLNDLFYEIGSSSGCIGSDSMVTNISSAMSVPTVSIHAARESICMADRRVYGNHAFSILVERGEKVNVGVIRNILSRFFS